MLTSAFGRLGKTPRDIETSGENRMAVTSLAVDVSSNAADPGPLWLGIVAFGRQADVLRRHDKGEGVSVSGRVQRRVYEGRDGQQHEQLQIVADTIVSARAVHGGDTENA